MTYSELLTVKNFHKKSMLISNIMALVLLLIDDRHCDFNEGRSEVNQKMKKFEESKKEEKIT